MKKGIASILSVCIVLSMITIGVQAAYTHETSTVGGIWSFSNDPIRTETVSIEHLVLDTYWTPEGYIDNNRYELRDYTAYVLPAGTEITAINAGDGGWGPNDAIFVETFNLDGKERNQTEMKGVSEQIIVEDATLYKVYGLYEVGAPGKVDPFYVKGVGQVLGKTPSAWAQEIVSAAESMGAVPKSVKQNYQANITRAQFAELIVQSIELTGTKMEQGEAFSDCSFDYVRKARGAGIVGGTGNNLFNPNAPITRQELAKMIMSAVDYMDKLSGFDRQYGINDAEAEAEILAGPMYADVSDWAKPFMRQANDQGFIQGDGKSLNPKGNATCEQSIVMVYRASIEYWNQK